MRQCFTVSANSEEEAIEAVKQGNGEFAFEEHELQTPEDEHAKVIDEYAGDRERGRGNARRRRIRS